MLASHPQLRSLAVAAAIIVVLAVALVSPMRLHAQSATPAVPGMLPDPAAPKTTLEDSDPVSLGAYWDTPPQSPTILRLRDRVQVIPGPEDQVRMIVLLDGAPLSTLVTRPKFDDTDELTTAAVGSVDAAAVRQQQAVLAAQQAQFVAGARAAGVEVQVNRNFVYLLNGVAISTKAGSVTTLRSLPGVTGIYPDYMVKADLLDSVPLVGAPTVWQTHDANGQPVTGEGIDVAIIDTGIDYTHPDLGGCFGVGCRVAGGWDFVNGDGDPKDDHSHGTHVAGIVAASGAITGVAPSAHLWAFKVLNFAGSGYDSTIIAGIERSADLDGDPITVDPADVANISLGGYGDPDDPMSQAVDAAVDAGVVVAVAAGNSGPSPKSLLSPGVARRAITVAASDKHDQIAYFSSRGPVAGFEANLKPDITAPGVSITSTVPEIGYNPMRYDAYSGTSMASPHVAGAAALLKQLHPTWSPLRIKSNLMNTAKDLGESFFTQGSGRLQVDKAIVAPMIVQPATIDLGYADTGVSGWQINQPITITNQLSTPTTYSLTIAATLPARIAAELSASSITVDPGKSRVVRLILHSALTETISADVEPADDSVMGAVMIQSEAATVKSYFALSIDGELTIQVDGSVPWVIVHNDLMAATVPGSYWGGAITLRLPTGRYDVVTVFPSYERYFDNAVVPATMVVKENVAVSRTTEIRLSRSDGRNRIQFVATTNNGKPLAATTLVSSLSHPAHGISVVATSTFISDTPSSKYSYATEAYRIEAQTFGTTPGNALTWYDGYYRQDGISGDATLVQDPALLKRILLQFGPAGMNAARIIARCVRPNWADTPVAPAQCAPILARSAVPLVAAEYMAPLPDDAISFLTSYRVSDTVYNWPLDDLLGVIGPDVMLGDDGALRLFATIGVTTTSVYTTTSDTLPIGAEPPLWAAQLEPSPTSVCLYAPRYGVQAARAPFVLRTQSAFVPFNEGDFYFPYGGVRYELRRADTLIDANSALFLNYPTCLALPAEDNYSLTFTYPKAYTVAGLGVNITAQLEFDTRRLHNVCADAVPPQLTALEIYANGGLQRNAPPEQPYELRFDVTDSGAACSKVASMALEYKTTGGWSAMPLQQQDGHYVANMPPMAAGTGISLRVTATDAAGNRLVYTADPAFVVAPSLTLPDVTPIQYLPYIRLRQ